MTCTREINFESLKKVLNLYVLSLIDSEILMSHLICVISIIVLALLAHIDFLYANSNTYYINSMDWVQEV